MNSYEEWGKGIKFHENLQEWSWQSPFGGQGMSPEEKSEKERIGAMMGYSKHKWNFWGKETRHGGDEMYAGFRDMVGRPHEDFRNFLNSNKINQNAPFRVAYDELNRVKHQVNKIAKNRELNSYETHLLINVLKNCHGTGNVTVKDLNELWRRITGVVDERGNVNAASRKAALKHHVNTPELMLRIFFGIGGGIFSKPSNYNEINGNSEKLLYKYYPKTFKEKWKSFGFNTNDKEEEIPTAELKPEEAPETPEPPEPPETPKKETSRKIEIADLAGLEIPKDPKKRDELKKVLGSLLSKLVITPPAI